MNPEGVADQLIMVIVPWAFSMASALIWVWLTLTLLSERAEWHGETHPMPQLALGRQGDKKRSLFELETDEGHVIDIVISETLALEPRVKLIHDFLSADECETMIAEGGGRFEASRVVGAKGENEGSAARTSSGTFLIHRSELIRRIETRIARVTQLPQENGEAFYLLRYQAGQEYKLHPDYFATDTPEALQVVRNAGGQRVATFFVYLSDVDAGGGTYFQHGSITVQAKRGQALFWWDALTDGKVDPASWHAGLPVVNGTKYCLTKWIRQQAFGTRVTA